ncbi:MAG TPA: 2OG-Fe(II) oxygenase family protein [Burkholderiaceae bacterium]|nr:2OG-Fe(II) oxygenase family protein [Burkholderiaceae bacterium]
MAPQRMAWLEASDVLPMFPSLVWKLTLRPQLRDALAADALAALAALRGNEPPLARGQGWQSPQDLHRREPFATLVGCIDDATRSILRFLHIADDAACEITGCWATVLAPGAAHKLHSHPNNFLSGVYYLRTSPGADTINFHDPRKQTAVIRPPVLALSAENTDQVVVQVSDGTLLMFPSYLEHSVDATSSDDERISVSFNLMFSNYVQTMSRPLW